VSWDTVSPGYCPLSWGYPGILRIEDAPRVPRRQLAFSDGFAPASLRSCPVWVVGHPAFWSDHSCYFTVALAERDSRALGTSQL